MKLYSLVSYHIGAGGRVSKPSTGASSLHPTRCGTVSCKLDKSEARKPVLAYQACTPRTNALPSQGMVLVVGLTLGLHVS